MLQRRTGSARPRPAGAAGARRALSMRVTLAAVAGAALTLAFPPYDLWPVAAVAVAALLLLVRGQSLRASSGIGFVAGLGFFLPLLHWTGIYVGPVPWLVLGTFQALYFIPLGAATALVQRLPAGPLWVACAWVGEEALRMRLPYGGFPWGRLAFSQADAPTLGLAALGGAPLVTFAVALAGALLGAALLAVSQRRLRSGIAALAGIVAVTLVGLAVPAVAATGPRVQVAIVQGNVPRLGLDFNAQRQAVLDNHVSATLDLASQVRAGALPQPDLVVWPENSSDIDPYREQSATSAIDAAVEAIGVPILVGAVVERDAHTIENTGIVWSPRTGPGQTYVKRHPVPFAEYIPMRNVARVFSSAVDRVTKDMAHGKRIGVLQVGPARVGDVICFEVAYDDIVRDTVSHGGQLLAVQTNNATFGRTPETEQQLVMSRLRAVEHARTVLVSSTSGVSAVIDADGSVRRRSEVFTRATFDEQVQLSSAETLATRLGAWPEAALAVTGALAVLVAAGASRRRRRVSVPLPPAPQPDRRIRA